MAGACTYILIVYLFLAMASSAVIDQGLSWVPAKGHCKGSIAEDEFEMESGINRRILATTQYISYAALQRNSVPCSQRGASYYNCQTGAEANPYNRGCTAITQCRS